METVTFWSTLMGLAKEKGKAEQSGDPERLRIATEKLRAYEQQCLQADKMIIPDPNVGDGRCDKRECKHIGCDVE